jgi:hypothetical protein
MEFTIRGYNKYKEDEILNLYKSVMDKLCR